MFFLQKASVRTQFSAPMVAENGDRPDHALNDNDMLGLNDLGGQ